MLFGKITRTSNYSQHPNTYQGRIQDFPRRGANPPAGELTYNFYHVFLKNCMKLRNFWSVGEPGAPPALDPPLQATMFRNSWILDCLPFTNYETVSLILLFGSSFYFGHRSSCSFTLLHSLFLATNIVEFTTTQLLINHYMCYPEVFFFFKKKILLDTCLFVGPLINLFWISGDVSSGFQSQSGFCLISNFAEEYVIYVPWDSPLVRHLCRCIMPA